VVALKNTKENYGIIAKLFHWSVAVIVIGMLCLGLYMTELILSPTMLKLYFIHKSFGAVVLALMVLRLFWRIKNITPAPLRSHKLWERFLSGAVHWVFYISLLALPLSGWAMSSAKGYPVSVFGWFVLPDFVGKDRDIAKLAEELHEILAYIVIGAIFLHIFGALKHHFKDKDRTLRRMTFGIFAILSIFLALQPASVSAETTDSVIVTDLAKEWVIDKSQSSISFEAIQMGGKFQGEFKNFDGLIYFDPERLDKSQVEMMVDITSVDTNDAERDGQILLPDWFNSESFPESRFFSNDFRKTEENQYVAVGELEIKNIKKSVNVPFILNFHGDGQDQELVSMDGEFVINRLDFGVGKGEWGSSDMIGMAVTVRVKLAAAAKD
jgi:cytochrome b561